MNTTSKRKNKQNGLILSGISNLRFAGAKRLLIGAVAVLFLAGCEDDKEPNTRHPDHGIVKLTTDWSNIGEGLSAPENYTVQAAGYIGTLSGTVNKLDYLFEPGDYSIYIYNPAQHLHFVGKYGNTVYVNEASGTVDGVGPFVHNAPGWLFTSFMATRIEADSEHTVTAVMQQQVRQLTLIIEPTGGIADMIGRIEGYLSGVAGTLQFAEGAYGAPSNVALQFTPIAVIDQGTKWTATVRLLGTAGDQQKLNLKIHFADGGPEAIERQIDLTSGLAEFNNDKRTPFTLNRTVELPMIPQ